MAGIYIHIPFCAQKCNYCDFYSIVSQKSKEDFLKALLTEISSRKDYLDGDKVETIYLGGGTPSILSISHLSQILDEIQKDYYISQDIELTLEANPENLSPDYLKDLIKIGFNRLSIGVQSFNDKDLEFLRRNHNSDKAVQVIELANKIGFDNISMDLIYGLPYLSISDWEYNLKKVFELPINHLSSYHLTYENGTVLNKKLKKGLFKPLSEDKSIEQFEMLMEYTERNKMPFYEISNFAKENRYSRHNTSYWQQKKYIGFGPSAHSFNLTSREWNISNLPKYIDGLDNGNRLSEIEELSLKDIRNEYLITRLRTKWGIDKGNYKSRFGYKGLSVLNQKTKNLIDNELILEDAYSIKLTKKGLVVSDFIIEKLFEI
jgi:oxygen-independent coproporphyrinogen-3 oxidase